jgi:hypothetical protein
MDLSLLIAGTGLAHQTAGLIRSLADSSSCLITVLPRGDRIQAGADPGPLGGTACPC